EFSDAVIASQQRVIARLRPKQGAAPKRAVGAAASENRLKGAVPASRTHLSVAKLRIDGTYRFVVVKREDDGNPHFRCCGDDRGSELGIDIMTVQYVRLLISDEAR